MTDDEFRSEIEAFLRRTGLAPSRFGECVCGDRNFVRDLRNGKREFKRSTIEKVVQWMRGFDAGAQFIVARSAATPHAASAVACSVQSHEMAEERATGTEGAALG